MADVIRKATNKFTKGLVMDFSPENTRNEVLTHALNATLLTFNGNELSLQNDMGNGRVETAFLPEGYMPVGTCEYGGIVYIVSYNPLENKSQIGCFPSPERNISSDELGIANKRIDRNNFQTFIEDIEKGKIPDGSIKNTTQYVLLRDDNLNPGDKFLVCSDKEIYNEKLADLFVDKDSKHYEDEKDDPKSFEPICHPILALNVVSIEDSGKIVYLNSDIIQYEENNSYSMNGVTYTDKYKYHILGKMIPGQSQVAKTDIDNYRNVLSSGYSVFKSKTSGRLAILAELIMIDSYAITHEIKPKKVDNGSGEGCFDIVIHTEISPEVTPSNYNIVPKLQYYYLKNSQGFLQATTPEPDVAQITKPLFTTEGQKVYTNDDFLNTKLSEIYVPTLNKDLKLNRTLDKTGAFNFPKPGTYHGRMQLEDSKEVFGGSVDNTVYTKFTEGKYHRIRKSQVSEHLDEYFVKNVRAKFYWYDASQTKYVAVEEDEELDSETAYFIKTDVPTYYDAKRNTAYKDETLYELITEPLFADDTILEDETIEKYEIRKKYVWNVAPESEWDSGKQLYVEAGDGYETFGGIPVKGNTYYFLTIITTYKSIGFTDINRNDYDDIYYYPTNKDYLEASKEQLAEYWDVINYPLESTEPWGASVILYYRVIEPVYRPATESELLSYKELGLTLYYKPDYVYINPSEMSGFNDSDKQLFMVVPMDTYTPFEYFVPNSTDNYILGYERPPIRFSKPDKYPYDDYLTLHTIADFIPDLEDKSEVLPYHDLRLGNIKIPGVVSANGLDLPFKYDYTIVPCMNYGRLDHLAVSNTVDFSKLHAFNQSNFSTWKYHIDGSQLRLTFGADVYDTYETDKVDGLVLEFYDLWGFAGSLEISERKSYSGIFTKILQLNALNALSRNRVHGSKYIDTFSRNISIVSDNKGGFSYGGREVVFKGSSYGWEYKGGGVLEDNDCGTLYSNILYGVKTYLKRTINKGLPTETREFIPKKTFFLYTLPIYNEFFYSVNDFSTLTHPQLDMMLTYKIQDSSTRIPYNSSTVTSGYVAEESESVAKYISGVYEKPTLNLTRYYSYNGISNVYLEVGLKKEYQDIQLSYSPDINKKFKCKLLLLGDAVKNSDGSTKSVSVSFDESIPISADVALGYDSSKDSALTSNINTLLFSGGSSELELYKGQIKNTNFITSEGKSPIEINYNFVVGYKANINDIKATEVKATTVCALCHKASTDPNIDDYNYEDFGVYKNEDKYLSNAMLYNSGSLSKEMFGLCQQIATSGNASAQLQTYQTFENDSLDIKTAGKLNSGEPLKNIVAGIGKLTFVQPHAHCVDETYGVNVYAASNGLTGIAPHTGTRYYRDDNQQTDGRETKHKETSLGIRPDPAKRLFNSPLYNLVLNTKNMMLYNGECISTMYKGTTTGTVTGYIDNPDDGWNSPTFNVSMRQFVGFGGTQVATFNYKMINTMKSVYAYNPDYDSLEVNVGKVSVVDNQVKFISNLVSTNAEFVFDANETLNDYVYFGSIKFTDYLSFLSKYSEDYSGIRIPVRNTKNGKNEPLEQVYFVPGLDYCGAKDGYYLVTTLTYNTPAPYELEDELSFRKSSSVVVKHSDGKNEFLEGSPNKKALYGYKEGHLVALDVSNYKIDDSGNLTITKSIKESDPIIIATNVTRKYSSVKNDKSGNLNYIVNSTYDKCRIRGTSLTLNDLVYEPNADGHRLFVRPNCWFNDNSPRNIIFYRSYDNPGSWNAWSDQEHKNHLYVQIGPCFTSDNL